MSNEEGSTGFKGTLGAKVIRKRKSWLQSIMDWFTNWRHKSL